VLSGLQDKGSILLVPGLSDPSTEDMAESPVGGSTVSYSNTSSTLTTPAHRSNASVNGERRSSPLYGVPKSMSTG